MGHLKSSYIFDIVGIDLESQSLRMIRSELALLRRLKGTDLIIAVFQEGLEQHKEHIHHALKTKCISKTVIHTQGCNATRCSSRAASTTTL